MSIKLSYHLKHSKSIPRRSMTSETDGFSLDGNAIPALFTYCWWRSLKIVECIGRKSHALLHLICSLSTFRCPGSLFAMYTTAVPKDDRKKATLY